MSTSSKPKTATEKAKAKTKATAGKPPAEASVYTMPIDKALADRGNARRRTDRNKATIKASLERFGAGRSIVLDGENIVRAGNGTLEQAADAGFREILVIEPAANQIVAVKRPDWTPAEAKAYAVADNRSAELAEWDQQALATIAREVQSDESITDDAIGFTDDEITALCEGLADATLDAGPGLPEAGPSGYSEQYAVIVICRDESGQAIAYEHLASLGYNCKVVTT